MKVVYTVFLHLRNLTGCFERLTLRQWFSNYRKTILRIYPVEHVNERYLQMLNKA